MYVNVYKNYPGPGIIVEKHDYDLTAPEWKRTGAIDELLGWPDRYAEAWLYDYGNGYVEEKWIGA